MEELQKTNYDLASLPDHARVWVYKAVRAFSDAECRLIRERGESFVAAWTAHGSQMDAGIGLEANRFIIIAADEQTTSATGCSIDASVQFIKSLEHELNITLTDRMFLVYASEAGTASCALTELPELISTGVLNLDAIVYDDLIATVGDFRTRFKTQLRNSWALKFAE